MFVGDSSRSLFNEKYPLKKQNYGDRALDLKSYFRFSVVLPSSTPAFASSPIILFLLSQKYSP